jgi:hypothetical protein
MGEGRNTDREIWRESEGDYYADSIFVTEAGNIGINVGGHVIVKAVQEWHALAIAACDHRWSDATISARYPCHCMLCGIPKVIHSDASRACAIAETPGVEGVNTQSGGEE